MAQKLPQAKAVLLNTYEELNPVSLTNYLKSKVKNLLCMGCLTLSITEENDGSTATSAGCCLFSWLDSQEVGSVVYISFRTVLELGSEELMALAEAIEFSGKPFLWSLKEKYKENLPKGFLERSKEKGKVVPWVAQRDVLQHVSIGVFVNHAGYNSMWEIILGGVPMICRSVWAGNHINAKVAEEKTKHASYKPLDDMAGVGWLVRDGEGRCVGGRLQKLDRVATHSSGNVLSFYTMPEYYAWRVCLMGNASSWTIKYYKGLGTNNQKEGKEYFKDIEKHKKVFIWMDDQDGNAIELAFSKKKIDERKNWLRQYQPGTHLDQKPKLTKYSEFINKELILFSVAYFQRSISSMIDGLKPIQRKILSVVSRGIWSRTLKFLSFKVMYVRSLLTTMVIKVKTFNYV
ncbi:hypothetical protein JCGZ_16790 [Jatropha curcas]|uniref:DNA topoisomerase (ATP-hydrolyzing) n=1 Tax=Jatropha curcas TaxID=180498 RepID=A0A067L8C1_JATCU|nr:hypothetical protein JCGZ_16790 [Jatropha curcas]